MENAQKALTMAGGLLLALMILAVVYYMIQQAAARNISLEELQSSEQRAKFNAEYEAYQKNLMYGVDVISCINKAISNNKAYEDYEPAHVDIYFTLKTGLQESVKVYHLENVSGQVKEKAYMNGYGPGGQASNDKHPDRPIIKTNESINSSYTAGEYELKNRRDDVDVLMAMDLQYRIDNPEKTKGEQWTYYVKTTALSDFKSRKFKCTELTYSPDTGRVDCLKFEEVQR